MRARFRRLAVFCNWRFRASSCFEMSWGIMLDSTGALIHNRRPVRIALVLFPTVSSNGGALPIVNSLALDPSQRPNFGAKL